jgi:hypothetical protein
MRAMQPRQASKWPTHVCSLMVAAPSAIPAARRIHLLVPRHVCGAHGQAEAEVCFRRRKQRFNQRPLRRRQIARIGNHPTTIPPCILRQVLSQLRNIPTISAIPFCHTQMRRKKVEKSMEPADEFVRGVVQDKSCNDVKLWERPRTQ